VENDGIEVVQVVDFEENEVYFEEETLDNEDIVENDAEEVVKVVDFKENEGYFEEENIVKKGAEEVV
jgi:hypothetical protein